MPGVLRRGGSQNGPTTCTPSPSARWRRDDVLRQLVGDDRRERDRRERQPLCAASRANERLARRRPARARPSPSRHERRAAASGSLTLPRLCRLQSMQSDAQGCASSRSRGISLPQLAQVPYVPSSMRFSAASISASTCSEFSRACSRSRGRASRVAVSARWLSLVAASSSTSSSSEPGCSSRSVASACSTRCALLEQQRRGSGRCRCSSPPLLSPRSSPKPKRGAARSAPARSPSAPRSCPGRRGPKRASAAVARERERLGEQAEDGLVRAAVLGRRGDAHLPGVAVPADDRRPARARADAQAQSSRRRRHALSLRRARPRQLRVAARRTSCAPRRSSARSSTASSAPARGRSAAPSAESALLQLQPQPSRSCTSRSFSAIARRWISRASACASLRISSASRRACSLIWADACSAETSVVRSSVSSSR